MKRELFTSIKALLFVVWMSQFKVCGQCSTSLLQCNNKSGTISPLMYSPLNECLKISKNNCQRYINTEIFTSLYECIRCRGFCYINNGGCSHICNAISFYDGFCECPYGMVLEAGYKKCIVSPCLYKGCSHMCYVRSGIAFCSCPSGMILNPNGTQCLKPPCYYENCSDLCIEVSGSAQCICSFGRLLKGDGKQCVDVTKDDYCSLSRVCSRSCPVLPSGCLCAATVDIQPDFLNCLYSSHEVRANFKVSSPQISKDVVKIMLTSYFKDYCSFYSCCYIDWNERLKCAIKQLNISTSITAFWIQETRLTLRFYLKNFIVAEEIVTKETLLAALHSGITFSYKNDWMAIASDDVPTNRLSNATVNSTNASLKLILACSFSGLLIFLVAIISFVRRKMRAEAQSSFERELNLVHEIDFDSQIGVNDFSCFNEPPPPYDPTPIPASFEVLRSEPPPDYSI